MNGVSTLSVDNLLEIHNVLTRDFANTKDPISPPGVRSMDMLQSAVYRQTVGFEGKMKYDKPLSNAASLCYGICQNHPFFNGNKRTALVALLCHMDMNGLTFTGDVKEDDLYKFMLKIADHKLAVRKDSSDISDAEVEEITRWIRVRSRQIKKSERVITYRELRSILKKHGIELENPKDNYINLVKHEERKKHIFSKEKIITSHRLMNIPYPGESKIVGKHFLKNIRKTCKLSEEDGCDSEIFYAAQQPLDYFIARYRRTLNRLART